MSNENTSGSPEQQAELAALQAQMAALQNQIQVDQQAAAQPQLSEAERQIAEMKQQMAQLQAQVQQQTGPVQSLPPAPAPAPAQPQPVLPPTVAAPITSPAPAEPVQPVPPVALAQTGGPAPDSHPQEKSLKGLQATLIVLATLLVASVVAIALVLFTGFSLAGSGGSGDAGTAEDAASGTEVGVVLAPAAAIGATAFVTAAYASDANPAVALASTGESPTGETKTTESVSGDATDLYLVALGGSSFVGEAPSYEAEILADPERAAAFVEALNSDPDLGWGDGELTVEHIGAYLKQLSLAALANDTWVTHYSFDGGAAKATQAVLQMGTPVMIDRYGVPRVRAVSGDPLTVAEAPGSSIVVEAGNGWPGFADDRVVAITPAGSVQDAFSLSNDGESMMVSALPCRNGGLGSPCDAPSSSAVSVEPADSSNAVVPVTTTCQPALADLPAASIRFVNNTDEVQYLFWVNDNSCDVDPVAMSVMPPGYSGGWMAGETTYEGGILVVGDGVSTTPTAILTFHNNVEIIQ